MNIYEETVEEIRSKYAVLSTESLDHLFSLLERAMQDAYDRGREDQNKIDHAITVPIRQ